MRKCKICGEDMYSSKNVCVKCRNSDAYKEGKRIKSKEQRVDKIISEKKHYTELEGNEKRDKKRCCKCLEIKTLTPEYWNRDKNMISGFNSCCKACTREIDQKYKNNNKEKIAEKNKTPEYVLIHIRSQAKKRGINFELDLDDIKKLWGQPCFYCGRGTIGWIDRKINDKGVGYTKENSVACCSICNRMKSNIDIDYFAKYVKKIAMNIKNNEEKFKVSREGKYKIIPWNRVKK